MTKKRWYLYILLTFAILLIYLNFDSLSMILLRGQNESDFLSMSGRIEMWQEVMNLVNKRPITGYGFGAGSNLISLFGTQMTSVHNGFFEVLLGLGYPGLLLLICLICLDFSELILLIKKQGYQKSEFFFFIFLYLFTRTLTSLGVGGWHTLDMLIFISFSFSISYYSSFVTKKSFVPSYKQRIFTSKCQNL